MNPLDSVKLTALMQRTSGRAEIMVGLIDGPVVVNHPDLVSENIREVPGKIPGICGAANSAACIHGTLWPVSYVQDGTLQFRRMHAVGASNLCGNGSC